MENGDYGLKKYHNKFDVWYPAVLNEIKGFSLPALGALLIQYLIKRYQW